MTKADKHNVNKKPEQDPEETPSVPEGNQAKSNGSADAPEASAAPEAAQEPLVGLTLAEFNELQKKVEQADLKAKEYFEGWQRERADFLNYRKRIERESVQSHQNITGQIMTKYLVILDDLELALKSRPSQGDGAKWAEGVELISRKLVTILDSEGIKPIEASGAMFDPTFHQAISHEDSPDHQSGQVIEVVRQGYTLGERVLRPALVRVAR